MRSWGCCCDWITKHEEGISLPCLVDGCEIGLDGSLDMALLTENQISFKLVFKSLICSVFFMQQEVESGNYRFRQSLWSCLGHLSMIVINTPVS